VVGDIIRKLADPSLKWYSLKVRGGFARWAAVTTSGPQLLHVCDEYICIPTRFSEYFCWSDGSGNLAGRIFPNNEEAWDHANESDPNTSTPYNGSAILVHGYGGYGGYIDLVCGTAKCTVTLVVRRYPEPQILIFNLSSSTIRVNDPPAVHGLSRYTTGTAGSGYVDLGQNQYVVYYRSSVPGVDTSTGFFSQSPLGTSKRWGYEIYVPSGTIISGMFAKSFPKLYTGIRAPKDIPYPPFGFTIIVAGSWGYGGINISGMIDEHIGGFGICKEDPYSTWGVWTMGNNVLIAYSGWAEDDAGNVKYIFESGADVSVNTKKEEKYKRHAIKLYIVDNDEWIVTSIVKPTVDTFSHGRNYNVISPDFYMPKVYAVAYTKSMYVKPDDSISEVTSTVSGCWNYYDAWALANFILAPISGAVAEAALWIYTDDPDVSIPTNVRQAFGAGYCDSLCVYGLQVLPFGDRQLKSGKTYAAAVRYKIFEGSVTSTDILNWAKRVYPKSLTGSEWSALLSTVPFRVVLMGARVLGVTVSVSAPSSADMGSTITVSGNVGQGNATVYVVMHDPSTYAVVASARTTSDSNGNFSVQLGIPSGIAAKTYKIMVISEK